jgi:4-hydroxy-3-methylbut-2-enyl diphosphate reductase
MKVQRAKVLGYCMGVRRAVEMALAYAREDRLSDGTPNDNSLNGNSLWTLGPLIHNEHVLAALGRAGFRILTEEMCAADDNSNAAAAQDQAGAGPNLKGAVVVLRAHGVRPQIKEELRRRGAKIVDATCPKVRKSQQKAEEFSKNGYALFIAGEKHHAEVQGIIGYAPDSIAVSDSNAAEMSAKALFLQKPAAKTALLAQTTISKEEFIAIAAAIKQVFPDLQVCDTICNATKDRQQALVELCGKTDAIIIAGDSRSANTRRLLAIARKDDKPAWLVESADTLQGANLPPPLAALAQKEGCVGISAGASTPCEIINAIEKALEAL